MTEPEPTTIDQVCDRLLQSIRGLTETPDTRTATSAEFTFSHNDVPLIMRVSEGEPG